MRLDLIYMALRAVINFNNDQKNDERDKRNMDLSEEPLFSLGLSFLDDLRTKDKSIVARGMAFRTPRGAAYKLMDLAKKGTMKTMDIRICLEELNVIRGGCGWSR